VPSLSVLVSSKPHIRSEHDETNCAFGGWFDGGGGGGEAATVTDCVCDAPRPPLSVTVSFTEYVPAAA
jgi:hypothetical protein